MSNYNTTLQSNNTDLQAILDTINELPQQVATPVISVNNSNGLITATTGTKSSTHQLAFQPAKTITPSATNQIAVSSGYYVGGDITVAGDNNLVAENIISGKSIFGVTGTATVGDDPFANLSPFTYTVNDVSGARYGFTKNGNGYYESQNKGQNNSYAICRVNLTVTQACDITFDVINYAESNYDYALFGNLDSALTLSYNADSNVKKNFKGQQSASVVNVIYNKVTVGNHYIDIKFIKDTSQHNGNDSVQFKIQQQGGLSQETINKILAADSNLIAENIKSGVSIFGVNGTLETGEALYDEIDSFITADMSNCTNNRITSIGPGAFAYASNLQSVSFPAATSIKDYAFFRCSKLTTVSIPEAKSIGNYAFCSCSSLTTAVFPACTRIEYSAFALCSNLTTVSFPVATYLGTYAFAYCDSLTTVDFPAVTYIHSTVFLRCENLTAVSFPVATRTGDSTFFSCPKLTTANFPLCSNINYCTFDKCTSLTTISFPAATSIGNYAFRSCYSLVTASFPAANLIDTYAFAYCYNLKSLYLTGSSLCRLTASNAFNYTPIGGYSTSAKTYGSIYVPASLLTSYQTATNWAYFSSRFVAFDSDNNIITFTIDGTEYQAEEGMTWTEWAESTYNTTEFIEYDGRIVQVQIDPFGEYEITRYITYDDLSSVPANDIINAEYNYRID